MSLRFYLNKTIAYLALVTMLFPLLGSIKVEAADGDYAVTLSGDGTHLQGYAWNNNYGWISFYGSNYGVSVSGTAVSGYAWSSNLGWLSFTSSDLAGCPQSPCSASLDSSGNMTGWARFLNWSDGWVHLAGTAQDSSTYGVHLGNNSSYAWSDHVGWIRFQNVVNTAPIASSVGIRGIRAQGQTLTGIYTYTDADSDLESGTTFQWYRYNDVSETYEAISGATSVNYTLTAADAGTFVKFEVTPRTATGVTTGTAVKSSSSGTVKYASQVAVVATGNTNVTIDLLQKPNESGTTGTSTTGQVTLPSTTSIIVLAPTQKLDVSTAVDAVANPTGTTVNGMSVSAAIQNVTGTVPDTAEQILLKSGTTSENIVLGSTDGEQVYMQDNTQIYANGSWDGTIMPPHNITNETNVSGFVINGAVAVGAADTSLVFDKAVKVTVPTISGNPYYRVPGGSWTEISTQCTDANGGGITFPSECYWKNGVETYIWTYHFTEYAVMVPNETGGTTGTQVTLDLTGVDVTIGAPAEITFPAVTSDSSAKNSEVSLSGSGNYFWADDLLGSNAGYSTTLQMANLTNGGGSTIAYTNVAIEVPTASVTKIDGYTNSRVNYNASLFGGYQSFSNTPWNYLYRNTENNDGLVGKYGTLPKFRITVPAFQAIGSYTGVLTYTLL